MLNFIIQFDTKATNFITSLLPHNTFFNLFFSFFSLRGSSIFIWIIILLFLIIFEEKRDKKFIIYFALIFTLTWFLSDILLKNIFHRPRPFLSDFNRPASPAGGFQLIQPISTACPSNFSFPSGHAATAFAAATVLAFFDKKRKWFYYLVAFLISLSRIYLFCHYFLDVVFGSLIGYFHAYLILHLRPIEKKT